MQKNFARRAVVLAAIVMLVTPAGLAIVAQPAAALGPLISPIVGGSGSGSYNGDGIPAGEAELLGATGTAYDTQGNLVIADSSNERVRVVAQSPTNPGYPLSACSGACVWTTGDIYTIAGDGNSGYNGDGIDAGSANLEEPQAVTIDAQGNPIIADTDGHRVRVVAVSGSNPGYPLSGCSGSCTWATGDIYTIAGDGTGDYNGDGIAAGSAELQYPYGVAVDANGNLLIGDFDNNRVRVVAVSGSNPGYALAGCAGSCTWTAGKIFTIAGDGNSDYNGDGTPATSASLSGPNGVVLDAQGNLVIGDEWNGRVRVVAESGSNPGYPLAGCAGSCTWTVGDIYTVAGDGNFDYNGDGVASTSADLWGPNGVAVDAQGNLVFTDTFNQRVRVVAVSPANPGYALGGCAEACTWTPGDIYTVAGNGSLGFTQGGVVATSAALAYPTSVAFSPQGDLAIADEADNLILRVALPTPTSINVPATAGDPNGFDSRLFVNNSVTLNAAGTWCNDSSIPQCEGPNGDTIDPVASGAHVLPGVAQFALIGRIGTEGDWHLIGSGPTTLNGTGELFLMMNDALGAFDNNSGSLAVTVGPLLNISSFYFADGPTMAGTDISWEGDLTNVGDTTLTNAHFFVSDGTDQSDVPTWVRESSDFVEQDSGSCDLIGGGVYDCVVPELDSGDFLTVDASIPTQGIQPGTLGDLFLLERSDQTPTCFIFSCHNGGAIASPQTQQIDGLLFDISAPAEITAGQLLTISGDVTNTSETDTINGITTLGTIDKGHITHATLCSYTNNSPLGTGASDVCPPPLIGSFPLDPGQTSDTESFNVDTTGLAGQTITWTTVATSPDIGGASYIASGTVSVVAPAGISIDTPVDGATLGRSTANTFTATPTPNAGDSVTSVDLKVDNLTPVNDTTAPYTRTIAASSLTVGTHTLTATMNQASHGPISDSITVNVVAAASVTITPPLGFVSGGVLDTAKTFTATATPNAPTTLTSVAWTIDNTIPVPSTSPSLTGSPSTATVNPAVLVLAPGAHTLRAIATDSTGQRGVKAFAFTVPQATLSVVDPANPANTGPIPPIAPQITPQGRSSWNVEVDNTSVFVAHHVALRIEAFAGSDPTPVDVDAIATAVGITAPCVPADGEAVSCNLGEIPAGKAVDWPVDVSSGVTPGLTISVNIDASAANAGDATKPLDPVDVIDPVACSCQISAQGPGSTFTNFEGPPTDANPTKQVLLLSPALKATAAHAVRFGRPFRPTRFRIRVAAFGTSLTTAIPVTLATLDPSQDPLLCPATCYGKVSSISGDFSAFNVQTNPILAVIATHWANSVPGTGLYMSIPATLSKTETVKQVNICRQDVMTRAYITPCQLPEIVKTGTDGTMTTYDLVLFTGDDPHFARR